ncbi:MAG: tetratricopeptide repeat protein [Pseudomonadota bacterium]
MRHTGLMTGLALATALMGCMKDDGEAEVNRALRDINVVDETNLNDIMLQAADPNEAVAYFQKSLGQEPDRLEFMRGLGLSLVRAGRAQESISVWTQAVAHPDATEADKLELADALIRSGNWDQAEAVLDSIPPTLETYKRYRLEAMVADSNKEWDRADSFYETAAGLTTEPGSMYNNWGFSKLARGDYPAAERLFMQAIRAKPDLFTAKNNLMLARGAQRKYDVPLLNMNQTERAQLLHTSGLAAVKQGDVTMARSLFKEAIDTHPQHFDAAVRSLRALETNVAN